MLYNMRSFFFYYTVTDDNIHAIGNNKFNDSDGELIVNEEIMNANGYMLGYMASIDIGRENKTSEIRVPETENGCPVSLFMLTYKIPDGDIVPDIGHPVTDRIYIPSTVRRLRLNAAASRNRHEAAETKTRFNLLDGCRVEVSPDNPYLCADENGIYSKDMTELVYILSHGEALEFPEGLKRIKQNSCSALEGMRRSVIPESVAEIEHDAFQFCPDLTEADIRAERIGDRAFHDCLSLTAVRTGSKIIGDGAFADCIRLNSLSLENTAVIGSEAFRGCEALGKLELPDTLREIGDRAFAATDIRALTIPPDAETLGQDILGNGFGLKVFMKNGLLPFKSGVCPVGWGLFVEACSFETNETLFRLVNFTKIDSVFTDRGIDMAKYDRIFRARIDENEHNCNVILERNYSISRYLNKPSTVMMINAAEARLENPYKLSVEMAELIKEFLSKQSEMTVRGMMRDPNTAAYDIHKEPRLDRISEKGMLRLIDESVSLGRVEITAVLMQKLNERKSTG